MCERYGPPEVVQVRDVPTPVPADDEVLVQVMATTVNSGDARVRALRVPRGLKLPMRLRLGVIKPKRPILGFEAAGRVEAVGNAVSRFQPGDRPLPGIDWELEEMLGAGGFGEVWKAKNPHFDAVPPGRGQA